MNDKRLTFSTNDEPSGRFDELPYSSKERLLTEGELRFYRQGLLPAVGNRFGVMCKVRLTDVLEVPPELWRAPAGRKVQQRHVDFVLVNKKTTAIVAVVELDDSTHLAEKQQEKDAYLADALHVAGVPLLRVPIYRRYNAKKLRGVLLGTLKRWKQNLEKPDAAATKAADARTENPCRTLSLHGEGSLRSQFLHIATSHS